MSWNGPLDDEYGFLSPMSEDNPWWSDPVDWKFTNNSLFIGSNYDNTIATTDYDFIKEHFIMPDESEYSYIIIPFHNRGLLKSNILKYYSVYDNILVKKE